MTFGNVGSGEAVAIAAGILSSSNEGRTGTRKRWCTRKCQRRWMGDGTPTSDIKDPTKSGHDLMKEGACFGSSPRECARGLFLFFPLVLFLY